MKGARKEAARRLLADELDDTLLHLARGLVGEGHREDRVPGCPFVDQPRDALRDHAGLAGARPREDEQRPAVMEDRLLLGRVERQRHA